MSEDSDKTRQEEEDATMRDLETQFYGEEGALDMPEKSEEIGDVHSAVRTAVERAPDASNSAEDLIDELQEGEILPESIHTPRLVAFLESLGNRFGVRINVDGRSLYPKNTGFEMDFSVSFLETFLRRGATVSALMAPILLASNAMAAHLPAAGLPQEAVEYVNDGGDIMYNWPAILAVVGILGILGYAKRKDIKKFKKYLVKKFIKTEKDKEIKGLFDDYEEAKRNRSDEEAERAKEKLIAATMGELPDDMDEAIENVGEIEEDEVKEAMKIKKDVDFAIKEAIDEMEKSMVLPNKKTIKNLNKAKAKALGVIGEQVSILGKLYDQLYQRAEELEDGYLKTQIKHELKKIEYFKAYLMMMEKKWLLAILSLKNEVLSKTEKVKGLSEEDKIQKNIWKLKNELNKFLDEEVGDEDVMHAQMATLDLEIQAQMEKLDATGGEGTADEEAGEVVIGHNTIFLKNSGLYTHATGVKYKINSEDKEFSIEEDVEVQIWINEDNQIKFNLLHKGELALKEELEIKNGDLYIKGETQSLKDYVEEHQNDAEVQAAEETVDVPAEVSEMVGKISDRALSVAERIKANEYRVFGENVEADDEAIKFHQVRIHREYSKGNPKTVVRFTLSESYWKKALAKINGDPSIPKSSVPFNFENGSGNSKSVNQQVRRFNVTAGKKKASVIIPADEHYRALTGEVRIILDPEDNFSKEEIQKLIEQAIVKLGVQKHFTEVTPASRARLQQRLKAMRKEDKNPAGSKDAVHDEYEAEQVDEEAIKDLRKAGLHSVYHQFGLDNLESVFKGGLLSTATRWAKGIFTEGLSSFKDLGTGGGSSAYARIHTKESASNSTWYNEKPAIVFAPEVFKRMDCYCYTSDTFGSTVPGTYDHRVSPKKLTNIMEKSYNSGNEVMFHDALDPKQAQYIVYNYPEKIIARLKKMGIKEIGGKSLEKAVITREEFRKINIIY